MSAASNRKMTARGSNQRRNALPFNQANVC